MYDVFISHASEDKKDVALPLANLLRGEGLQVWLDVFELTIGDSLREKIDSALAESRFGIVILNPRYFEKEWTQRELNALIARGGDNILPIWHNIDENAVQKFSPILADRMAVSTSHGIKHVADQVMKAIRQKTRPNKPRLNAQRTGRGGKMGALSKQRELAELRQKVAAQHNVAKNQIGNKYTVNTRGNIPITVRLLKRTGLNAHEVLHITWETIGEGAEYLLEQIHDRQPVFNPDLVIGINQLGTIVASYLVGTYERANRHIGIVCTGTPDKATKIRPTVYSLPENLLKNNPHKLKILLVDGELKSGRSTKQIIGELKKKLDVDQILVATLAACRVARPVNDVTKIRFKEDDGTQKRLAYLPDFLAFLTTGRMQPPRDIP